MVSSRAALLALIAFVALATSVVAQTCVVTVTSFGTDSTCVNATAHGSVEDQSGCVATGAFSYLATSCTTNTATSGYSVTVWNPEAGGCTGGSGTTASGTGAAACTAVTGGGLSSTQYLQVNCSCSAIIPAVSSSSATPTSSSSTGMTALSSSAPFVPDTGCPRRFTQYTDATCTTQSSALDVYSQTCAAFPTAQQTTGYYLNLICADSKATANWQATVYELSTCKGSIITSKTSDPVNPTACTTATTLGSSIYFIANCSCDGGRKYSTGIQSSSSTGSSISGSTSMTSLTSMTSMTSLTTMTSTTARGSSSSSSTGSSSTTGRTSSAPASRSSVVAIVAAVAAGVVALMA